MSEKIMVKGIEVELFEKSFRVDGMSRTVYLNDNESQHNVKGTAIQLVSAIYEHVEERAEQSGKQRALQSVIHGFEKVIMES